MNKELSIREKVVYNYNVQGAKKILCYICKKSFILYNNCFRNC